MTTESKIIKVTLFLSLFLIIFSCHKNPKVCFAANNTFTEDDPNKGTVNTERTFVVTCDRDASSYQWDFGDSTQLEHGNKMPHTYTKLGTYTITCTGYTKKDSTVVTQLFEVVP